MILDVAIFFADLLICLVFIQRPSYYLSLPNLAKKVMAYIVIPDR